MFGLVHVSLRSEFNNTLRETTDDKTHEITVTVLNAVFEGRNHSRKTIFPVDH